MTDVTGKKVLVTGAGTGIGKGIALCMARSGAEVVFHYHSSRTGAEEAVDMINKNSGKAYILQADLSVPEACAELVEKASSLMGGLDVLVNNSGVTSPMGFTEVTLEKLNAIYSVNFQSYFFCSQQAVRELLKARGGVIINISSVHGFAGVPDNSAYASMKGAINALTRELAIELAPEHIRVNAIAPGHVEVDRHFTYQGYSTEEGSRGVPWGRVGHPEDIGNLAVFLASDASEFITGQIIYADGGLTSKLALQSRRSKDT